jgi:mono/diheme cytochrome c family protein
MKSSITGVLLSLLAIPSALMAEQGSLEAGKTVFMDQCSVCHGADGSGKTPMAQSLNVTIPDYRSQTVHRLSDEDIRKVIMEGKGTMPPVPSLSSEDIANVIAFVRSFPLEQSEATIVEGSTERGEELFTGRIPFKNGGPPCSGCHTVSGLSFPGGGTLGPNLTRTYSKLGPEGLSTALHTLFFPTMAPLYDRHLLTPSERSDLFAFFQQADSHLVVRNHTIAVAAIALAGFAILLFLTWVLWRDRLRSVRRTLVETALSRGSVHA